MLYSWKSKRLYIGEKFATWFLVIGKIYLKKGIFKKKSSSLNSVRAPDLQSKIRISKNSLRHDLDLKKSAPSTSLSLVHCLAFSISGLVFCHARLTFHCPWTSFLYPWSSILHTLCFNFLNRSNYLSFQLLLSLLTPY